MLAAIRNSGLLEKLFGSTVGEEAEYKTFLQRTGFDYKRDLDTVLMSSASGVHYLLLKGASIGTNSGATLHRKAANVTATIATCRAAPQDESFHSIQLPMT